MRTHVQEGSRAMLCNLTREVHVAQPSRPCCVEDAPAGAPVPHECRSEPLSSERRKGGRQDQVTPSAWVPAARMSRNGRENSGGIFPVPRATSVPSVRTFAV